MKLKSILLVDDNVATNILHQKMIKRLNLADHVYICTSAEQALNFLKANQHGIKIGYVKPDLLFLDINMPGMDGWDFLDEYAKMPPEFRGSTMIFMLTTSINPDDKKRAEMYSSVSGFLNKPLLEQTLQGICSNYFRQE